MAIQNKSTKLAILSGSGVALLTPLAAVAETAATEGAQEAQPTGSPDDLRGQVTVITNTLLLIIGIVAVIMLIVGGFRYVLSNGNEKAVSGAKDTILYAIVGIVVAVLSFAIVNFVLGRFS